MDRSWAKGDSLVALDNGNNLGASMQVYGLRNNSSRQNLRECRGNTETNVLSISRKIKRYNDSERRRIGNTSSIFVVTRFHAVVLTYRQNGLSYTQR